MEFTCIDIETANHDRAIIEIAIVKVWPRKNTARRVWHQCLNPEADFVYPFEQITGKNNRMLVDQPTFGEVCGKISRYLGETHVVSHGPFDRDAILKCASRYEVLPEASEIPWLNSIKIVRRVWPKLPNAKLGTVARYLQIEYDDTPPKSALKDAEVLARVVARACQSFPRFDIGNWSNIARIESRQDKG